MAFIAPFKAIYYDPRKVDLRRVTAPPYDIISSSDQSFFYRRSPYNAVRLILGEKRPGDNRRNNRNIRAALFFRRWLGEGVLREDVSPAVYVYRQRYKIGGKTYSPLGFIALSRLEEFRKKKVLPHEVIFSRYKNDRLNLLKATAANFESILALYPGKTEVRKILRTGARGQPLLRVLDTSKVEHVVYPLREKSAINAIRRALSEEKIFIADGHHRYQAALSYWREKSRRGEKKEGIRYLLTTFMEMDEKDLLLFPTHRVVKKAPDFSFASFRQAVSPLFSLSREKPDRIMSKLKTAGGKSPSFALLIGDKTFILSLKQGIDPSGIIREKKSREWKKLDVAILQHLIFPHILGSAADDRIFYTRDGKEAFDLVRSGKYPMAFLLNPPSMEQVRDIASRGEKMPPKTTYFYPKLLSGLVMRSMNGKG